MAAAQEFGDYEILERIGAGGMATVHRAVMRGIEGLERIVALKRLLPHLAEEESYVKAFVREAKVASLLNHVNIVQVFELGRVGTEYFISMELLEGYDIGKILRQANMVTGPPPVEVTVGLLLQLCDALEYAHTKTDAHNRPLGIVHRDLSPSNLIVTFSGHLKVIDFGVAKARPRQLQTHTGSIKGKLSYMSPEAMLGAEIDARSDIFSTGVIGHELVTARPLFNSRNDYDLMKEIQRGEAKAPSAFNQKCPPELDQIILKAVAEDVAARFQSAGEMRDALLGFRDRHQLMIDHRTISTWIDWAFSFDTPQQLASKTDGDLTAISIRKARGDHARPNPIAPAAADRDDPTPPTVTTHSPASVERLIFTPIPSAESALAPPFAVGSDDPIAELAQVWRATLRPSSPSAARAAPVEPSLQTDSNTTLAELAAAWRSAIHGPPGDPDPVAFDDDDTTTEEGDALSPET